MPGTSAIYVRVSSHGQEDGYSLESQEERSGAFSIFNGYDPVRIYREIHTGAELWERPQLTLLREAIRRHEFDAVIFHALDRLSREPSHMTVVNEEAKHYGVRVLFVTEEFDDTPQGEIMRQIRGYAGQVELEKIRERTERGKRGRVASGAPLVGGKPPYGYDWADDRKRSLVIDPATAPVVHRLFREVAEGRTLRSIIGGLFSDHVPSPTGLPAWHISSVSHLLKDERYTGQATAYRTTTRKVRGKRIRVATDPDARVQLPEGTFPPLVDRQAFDLVQAVLAKNKLTSSRNCANPELYLLRGGHVHCGLCGRAMSIQGRAPGSGRGRYRCTLHGELGEGCPLGAVSSAVVDGFAWSAIVAIAERRTLLRELLQLAKENDSTEEDLRSIDRAVAANTRKQDAQVRALSLFEDQGAAAPVVREIEMLAAQRRQLDSEREEVLRRRVDMGQVERRLAGVDAWLCTVGENIQDADYARRRWLVEAIRLDIQVFPPDDPCRFRLRCSLPDGNGGVFFVSITTTDAVHNLLRGVL